MQNILFRQPTKALLTILIIVANSAVLKAQVNATNSFGNNATAGHYLRMSDSTKIYYELYGAGKSVVLLHGGLFGDISEFEKLIPKLSEHFQVIAIETRGHGKSEIGRVPYSYSLMASDVYSVIRHVTRDSVDLIGFSDGAISGMALTIAHPELVKKFVFVGGNLSINDYRSGEAEKLKELTGESIARQYPDFVKERKTIMPEPDRWSDFVDLLKQAWMDTAYFDQARVRAIRCPVMLIRGDRDQYISVETSVKIYRMIANAQLAIIPNSDHIVFYRRPDLMEALIIPFLNKSIK